MMKAMDALKRAGYTNIHPVYKEAFEKADKQNLWPDYGINTDLIMCHFLAQVIPETGHLKIIRENMSYSAKRIMEIFGVNKHSAKVTAAEAAKLAGNPQALADRVYGIGNPKKAKELGNTRPGDGYKYRGGGPLQLTGGGAYKAKGKEINVDLYNNPDLIADPEYILLPSLIHWRDRKCSVPAAANDIRKVTYLINGGYNGYTERVQAFNKLWAANKNVSPVDVAKGTPELKQLQSDLNDLGANPQLTEDGIMGEKTEAAIRAFQQANRIPVTGIAGDQTLATIKARLSGASASSFLSDTPTPSNAATAPTNVAGGTLTTAGLVLDQLTEKSESVKSLIGDNQWLQLAIGAVVVVGLGFIAYGFIRKYLNENRTLMRN